MCKISLENNFDSDIQLVKMKNTFKTLNLFGSPRIPTSENSKLLTDQNHFHAPNGNCSFFNSQSYIPVNRNIQNKMQEGKAIRKDE